MKQHHKITFFIVLAVVLLVGYCAAFGLGDTGITGVGDIRLGIDIRGGVNAVFEPQGLDRAPTSEELDSARAVIENRLDAKNILDREVTVDQESGQIIVNFPWKSGETDFDPAAAIAELGETAMLTFKDEAGKTLLTGEDIARSYAATVESSTTPVVMLEFTPEGRSKFSSATADNVGKRIYIYMDETLLSDPVVREAIDNDSAYIDNMASMEVAKDLADKINAGALPFSLTTTNYSTISPTLGQGALTVMLQAALVAVILVVLFILIRYRLPGFITVLALVFQIGGQLLCISIPQLTMTLPGIAGVILTLGMGVDAGIIISERIAEEIRRGYPLDRAVESGFHNALSAVLDGNITSIIVAIILIIFGSGTMLSFGYTLFFGIAFNLLAVLVTRLMLTSLIRFKAMRKDFLFYKGRQPKIRRFYEGRKISFAISAVVIVIGIAACFINGVRLDTQFTGGSVLRYSYVGELDENAVESVAEAAVDRPASTQYTTDLATGENKMIITFAGNQGMSTEEQNALESALGENFPDNDLALSESNVVQPYIGQRAMRNSGIAIALAAVLMLIYVAIRFSVISGISAGVMSLLALLHDIFVVFAVFVVFRIPLNDAYVAVTLTILGYSINSTIVNYDRIRENRRLRSAADPAEIVDLSVSQCFSRSLGSNLTTFVCIAVVYVFALLFGISSIQMFALPMAVGLLSGFFSSTWLAGPLWVIWQNHKKNRKLKKQKA